MLVDIYIAIIFFWCLWALSGLFLALLYIEEIDEMDILFSVFMGPLFGTIIAVQRAAQGGVMYDSREE